MPTKKRRKPRDFSKVEHYFHNYEHDPKGLNHCHSNGNFPYTIVHNNGKHEISFHSAIGHGKGGKPQKFRFTERLGKGWNLASGIKVGG